MGSIAAIFSGIGKFILQIFLQGLFKQVLTQIQDEAQNKVDASTIHVQSTQESANTEVVIAQEQAKIDHKFDTQVPNPQDPFHSDDWNEKGAD